MVPRDRIELPTRGFSDQFFENPKLLELLVVDSIQIFQLTFSFVWNCLEAFDLDGHNLGTILFPPDPTLSPSPFTKILPYMRFKNHDIPEFMIAVTIYPVDVLWADVVLNIQKPLSYYRQQRICFRQLPQIQRSVYVEKR